MALAGNTVQAYFFHRKLYPKGLGSHAEAVSNFSNASKTRHLGTLYPIRGGITALLRSFSLFS